MSIEKIGQVALTVSNVEQALVFYRDKLGLTFLFAPNENLAFLQTGETRIMLSTPQGAGEVGKNSILYFKTFAIEKIFAQLEEQGVIIERVPMLAATMPDHEFWTGFIRDPDNNLVALMEEKPLNND